MLDVVDRANDALRRGAWQDARTLYEHALQALETAEALEGLGEACWWLDDVVRVGEARERAYLLYRQRGDDLGAARVALALAEDALIFRGEEAVMNGWTERARRLLAELDHAPEHALLAVHDAFFAFKLAGDMQVARRRAGEAIELARRFRLFDLEMYARSIDGVARVRQGHVAEGMRILDEATAAATSGEMHEVTLIGYTCCFMIYGCECVRDYRRAAQWCERVRDFSQRNGLVSLLGVCRNHYAMVLAYAGDWAAAEAELMGAAQQLAARPAQAAEGVARLAELRRRQGRLDEAATLFEQVAFMPEGQIGRALLALDHEQYGEAAWWMERLLRHIPESDRTLRATAYEILARARASLGEIDAARQAVEHVESAAADIGTVLLRAAASSTSGAVALAAGDAERARTLLEDAVDLFERSGMPFEAAESRRQLSQALRALGHASPADAEAVRAAQTLARLGAVHAEARARREVTGPGSKPSRGALTTREIEVLRLVGEGLSDKAIAARLTISEHTVHRHISNILRKLDVSSRAAATAQALKLGVL